MVTFSNSDFSVQQKCQEKNSNFFNGVNSLHFVPSGYRLFGYGIGIHLLQAEDPSDIPRKKEINPKDNHISFQARF